ncbi:MAG: hydantoinase/oxoprolinase family protein, partial [Planctomycetaceae bacterium]
MKPWEFWIDVGGTFTDCLALSPEGKLHAVKTLSSGRTKGRVAECIGTDRIADETRRGDPDGFWTGYTIRFLDATGDTLHEARVAGFQSAAGLIRVDCQLPETVAAGCAYELDANEEAPIVAIRRALGLPSNAPIPPVIVKLGTTRGTNALLERKGARTAFVTTRGFADVLLIGNQDRPRLFDLAIQKPEPLFERAVEIDERIDVHGNVLRAPNEVRIREQFAELQAAGVESVAICLLHSFANSEHERIVERLAREAGFDEISVSSKLSPLIKIVSRGDTTVMDAYLNPILREYVATLRSSLDPQPSTLDHLSTLDSQLSTLKIMTSAGGLIDADRFVGKDSILSGPAGGVIGFSRVAQRAGFEKSIGFDMGGTSTDVSRFDGTYDLEFETKKAGVRVVAPMLAIETVAAGGGSICGFDGVKLFVGPHSAGADPGPACYGRGGPLTVTDVNLHLGKILPAHFPFPLDRAAVERRLEELCERIASSPLGTTYSPAQLAEGFVEIANANMTRAIRNISVAKGYDPADYALVTFGGAGAQHACAIARALGMTTVLIHPFAGILSAYGIGLADVRRFGERSVLQPYSDETLASLEAVFAELEAETVAAVRAEGVTDDRIAPPVRSLDLRYRGVEATLNVPHPEDGDYARRYDELHRQMYGYAHAGRTLEITAARVEVTGHMPEPAEATEPVTPRTPEPSEWTETIFHGEPRRTGVFLREHLHAGDTFPGPAIVCEPTSTIVIDPGWTATIAERGEVVLSADERPVSREPKASEPTRTAPDIHDRAITRENWNDVATDIRRAIRLAPDNVEYRRLLRGGQLNFQTAASSQAGDPAQVGLIRERCRISRAARDWEALDEAGEDGLALDPQNVEFHIAVAEAALAREYHAVAVFAYRCAMRVSPVIAESLARSSGLETRIRIALSDQRDPDDRLRQMTYESARQVMHQEKRDEASAEARPERPHQTTDHGPLTTDNHPDPVRLEIFNNLFASIAEQMGIT